MDDRNDLSQHANTEPPKEKGESSLEDTVDLSETKSHHAAGVDRAGVDRAEPDETLPALAKASSTLQPSEGEMRYHVLRPHAKGGLGEVFVARDRELNREVALKEIQQHHADDLGSRSRFLLEAEVTGGLEHPGIVPVYGLGQYGDGRPYYAMRFIRGDSLKEAVDTFHAGSRRNSKQPASESTSKPNALEPPTAGEEYTGRAFRALLGRFIDVCNAIEYAHSRGVLHRDLKPGNVMLGRYGETLVVDWGLAKVQGRENEPDDHSEGAIRPASGSSVDSTRAGSAMGTPAFMPPEQAAGRLEELGPTSDVYSLGATLYYVLTGQAPFRGKDIHQLLQQVQQGEFQPPHAVNAKVPKPLEAICLRAMATQPQDRYASPQELADDTERYLADEAVHAHREPFTLRARRWLRKHPRTVSAMAATVLVGLISSSVIAAVVSQHATVVQGKNDKLDAANEKLLRKNGELQLANEAERTAKADALAVNSFFQLNVLARARPKGQDGGLGVMATIQDAVDAAEPLIAESFADRPLVEASIRDTMGLTYWRLGELEPTIRQHELALGLRKSNLGEDHPDTLISMNQLALAYKAAGRLKEALPLYETTFERMKNQLGHEDVETLQAMNNLAIAYSADGQLEKSLSMSKEILKLRTEVLGPNDPSTLNAMNNLASAYQDVGRLNDALPIYEETLTMRTSTLGSEHPDALMSANNLAFGYAAADRWDEARPIFEKTLEKRKVILGLDHPDTLISMDNLARAYRADGRLDESLLLNEQTLELKKKKLGLDHPQTLTSMNNLAVAYREAGRLKDALPMYEQTLKARQELLGPEHPDTLTSMSNLANAYKEAGRLDEALPLYEKVLKLRTKIFGANHAKTLSSMNRMAGAYRASGRLDEALPIYEKTLELRRQTLGPDHRDTLTSTNNLALAYMQAGRLDKALPMQKQVLALQTEKLGRDHPSTLLSMSNLAFAYANAGRLDEALPIYEETLKLRQSKLGPDHPKTLLTMGDLAQTYVTLDQPEKGLPLFEQFIAAHRKRAEENDPAFASKLAGVAFGLGQMKQHAAAETYLRECLQIRKAVMPGHWLQSNAQSMLGGALVGQKKFAQAEPLLIESYQNLKATEAEIPDHSKSHVTDSLRRLIQLYSDWGKPDEAKKWRSKLEETKAKLEAEKSKRD